MGLSLAGSLRESDPGRKLDDDHSRKRPAMTSPAVRKRVWSRCGVVLSIAASVISFGILSSIPPAGTTVAQCFQRGGYNPPPCNTAPPTTSNASAGASNPSDTTQSASSSTDTTQSGSSPTATSTSTSASSPPDSSVIACQNQSAMAAAIGLPQIVCPSSQPGGAPADLGVNACQNQIAMAINIGLQPVPCPPSQPGGSPPDSSVTACQNQSIMSTNVGLPATPCPPSQPGSSTGN